MSWVCHRGSRALHGLRLGLGLGLALAVGVTAGCLFDEESTLGLYCEEDVHCAGIQICEDNLCVDGDANGSECVEEDNACQTDDECCADLVCDGGACTTAGECVDTGYNCEVSGDCCEWDGTTEEWTGTCVNFGDDYGSYCGVHCYSGDACASGCCAPLENQDTVGVCAPAEFC